MTERATTLRMRLPRAPRGPATAPTPRYRAQQLPESDRWSIYDSEEVGEVCSCPSSRVEGILAALNGQAARESACGV